MHPPRRVTSSELASSLNFPRRYFYPYQSKHFRCSCVTARKSDRRMDVMCILGCRQVLTLGAGLLSRQASCKTHYAGLSFSPRTVRTKVKVRRLGRCARRGDSAMNFILSGGKGKDIFFFFFECSACSS